MEWYVKVWQDFLNFEARAHRTEFWMFTLIHILVSIGLQVVGAITGLGILYWLYSLAVILPGIAVSIRRMHDIGKSGWWLLVCLVPILGALFFIFLAAQDSEPGANQWGANPKGVA